MYIYEYLNSGYKVCRTERYIFEESGHDGAATVTLKVNES